MVYGQSSDKSRFGVISIVGTHILYIFIAGRRRAKRKTPEFLDNSEPNLMLVPRGSLFNVILFVTCKNNCNFSQDTLLWFQIEADLYNI